MAIQTEPTRIQIPFADSGTKNVIPDTNSTPSASQAASWTDGFPAQCSLPLSAGGIPPARADFNGIFNTMTQSIRYGQEGGVWAWDATVDYGTSRVVLGSDGLLYWSVAQSGPNVGGAQDPTADTAHTYWVSPKVSTMPAGDRSSAAASTQWVDLWQTGLILPSDIYVDAVNGDDSNDGLSAATAFKTIGTAELFLGSAKRLKPSQVTVHVAPGTYADNDNIQGIFGLSIVYDFQSGASIDSIAPSGGGKTLYFTGTVTIRGRVGVSDGTSAYLGAKSKSLSLTFNNISRDIAIQVQFANLRPFWTSTGVSIIFTGTCTLTNAVVYLNYNGFFDCRMSGGNLISWSTTGTVTGRRYFVDALAALTAVGGPNVIPGSSAGSVNSLGVFN